MVEKKYIIAGTYSEFENFVNKKRMSGDQTQYIFVEKPEQLYGLVDIKGYYVGSYRQLPEIESIMDRIETSKRSVSTNVYVSGGYDYASENTMAAGSHLISDVITAHNDNGIGDITFDDPTIYYPPQKGTLRYDFDAKKIQAYDGNSWTNIE